MNDHSDYTASPFSDRDNWWILIVGSCVTGGGSWGGPPALKMQQQVRWKLLLQSLATFAPLVLARPDPPFMWPSENTFHSLLSLEEGVLDRATDEEGLSLQEAPLLSRLSVRAWLWPWAWLWPALRWWWWCVRGVILKQWTPSKLWKAFLNSWLEHG